jgi:mannose-1-phosphate guanylyltransferase
MTYAVIMAGGRGTRFWPLSRQARPKQFMHVLDDDTLIQNTVVRLLGMISVEQCYIVTHENYVDLTKEQLPALPEENILAEPISRNTAPCITFAAMKLLRRDPDATMVVLPADHVIRNVKKFQEVLSVCIETAQQDNALLTIGIEPTHPATGYGYIQYTVGEETKDDRHHAYPVKTFAEKPDEATAERFIDSGDFLWNSGIFIWRADSILKAVKEHLPDVTEAFAALEESLGTDKEAEATNTAFSNCPGISIDYGVMERARNTFVVKASFDWSDVGDWQSIYELQKKGRHGNAITGNAIVQDSSRCLIHAENRLVVLVGIHDAVVVDTEDATLICHRQSTQQVKNVVDYIGSHQLGDFL